MGQVRGLGCGQACRVDRAAVPVLGGSAKVHVRVNPESVVCVPSLVTSCPCQPQRGRGHGCLCLCFMWVLYVGAADSSALAVAVCVTVCFSVCLCVCVCLCVYVWLWDKGSASLQVESADMESGSCAPQPGQRSRVSRTPGCAPAARQEDPGPEQLEEVAALPTSLNKCQQCQTLPTEHRLGLPLDLPAPELGRSPTSIQIGG